MRGFHQWHFKEGQPKLSPNECLQFDPSPVKYLWRRKLQSRLFPYSCCTTCSLRPSLSRILLLIQFCDCFKTLLCRIQWCDHWHEVVLHGVIYDHLWLFLLPLVIGSSYICSRLFDHGGHKGINIMLFKDIQHPHLPCVEALCSFKSIFRSDGYWCHCFKIFLNASRSKEA